MSYGIGIDFGTTNSIAAIYDTEDVRPLTNKSGMPHPSIIWFSEGGEKVIVGEEAKNHISEFSGREGHHYVNSIKRKLGESSPIAVFGEKIAVHQVASHIFKHLRNEASSEENSESYQLDEAIVTIPVNFDGPARKALRTAADNAGLYIKTFIHEPFAAIVAHYYQSHSFDLEALEEQIILVFDWGEARLILPFLK